MMKRIEILQRRAVVELNKLISMTFDGGNQVVSNSE